MKSVGPPAQSSWDEKSTLTWTATSCESFWSSGGDGNEVESKSRKERKRWEMPAEKSRTERDRPLRSAIAEQDGYDWLDSRALSRLSYGPMMTSFPTMRARTLDNSSIAGEIGCS